MGVDHETNIVSALVETVTRLVVRELLEGEQRDFLGGRGRYDRRGDDQTGPGMAISGARCAPREVRGCGGAAGPGRRRPFRSSLMGFLDGNSKVLESLVNEIYARGPSPRDVEDAFRDATGELLISKSAVSDIADRLWEDYQAFISRDLSDLEVEYLFVDAVFGARRARRERSAPGRLGRSPPTAATPVASPRCWTSPRRRSGSAPPSGRLYLLLPGFGRGSLEWVPPGGGSSGQLTLDRGVGRHVSLEMPALCPAAVFRAGWRTDVRRDRHATRTPWPWR